MAALFSMERVVFVLFYVEGCSLGFMGLCCCIYVYNKYLLEKKLFQLKVYLAIQKNVMLVSYVNY
jgi:hypothetical protein